MIIVVPGWIAPSFNHYYMLPNDQRFNAEEPLADTPVSDKSGFDELLEEFTQYILRNALVF